MMSEYYDMIITTVGGKERRFTTDAEGKAKLDAATRGESIGGTTSINLFLYDGEEPTPLSVADKKIAFHSDEPAEFTEDAKVIDMRDKFKAWQKERD